MSFDELIKYLTWIIFFGIIAIGLYFTLKKLGVM